MNGRLKRYVTIVLSLAMIVGLLPQTFAHAEEVTPNAATGQKGQVSFSTTDGGQLRVWTDNGSEFIISKDNNNVLLEYEAGETIHTEVQENQGYEVATYRVTTDGGYEKDMLAEKSTDIVVTEEKQEVEVTFSKKLGSKVSSITPRASEGNTDAVTPGGSVEEEDVSDLPDDEDENPPELQGTLSCIVGANGTVLINGSPVTGTLTFDAGTTISIAISANTGYEISSLHIYDSNVSYVIENEFSTESSHTEVYQVRGSAQTVEVEFDEAFVDEYENADMSEVDSTTSADVYKKFYTTSNSNLSGLSHGRIYESSKGELAYCGKVEYHGPGSKGYKAKLNKNHSKQKQWDYIMYYGYPRTTTINGVKFSKKDAHDITQVAIWKVASPNSKLGLGNSKKNAAWKALVKGANEYDGKNKLINGSALYYEAKGVTGKRQPMVMPNMKPKTGRFKLVKESANNKVTNGNPNYSLKGAEYTIYKGKLTNGSNVSGMDDFGVLTTEENGVTNVSDELEVGEYTVVETKAPEGYSKNPCVETSCLVDSRGRRMYNVTVPVLDKDEDPVVVKVLNSPQMDPLNLAIRKFNKESGLQVNGGNANFDVEYKFSYYYTKNMTEAQCKSTQPSRVWYMKPNSVTGRLTFDEDYLLQSKSDSLYYNERGKASVPIGTLTIEEVSAAGTGYLVENTVFRPVQGATINGNFVLWHINGAQDLRPDLAVYHTTDSTNDIRRGDLKFVKVDSKTMDRLANVPFKITSQNTGESHIIVTDINGQASTEASWATRDDSCNLGQSYDDGVFFTGYGPDSVVSDEDKANGVTWQTGYDNVMKHYPDAAAKNKVGALPYDSYVVEEQRCAANEGKELLRFVVNVGEQHHNKTIDMGTLDNHEALSIYTIAKDSVSLSKEANASGEVTLVDTVHYAYNGRPGDKTYIAVATIMDKETKKPLLDSKGEKITATKEFTPRAAIGEVDVPITFNGADVTTSEDGTFKSKDTNV